MAKLTIRHGETLTSVAFDGAPLLSDVFRAQGLTITTPCGGKGLCGKCKVLVNGTLSEPTKEEIKVLSPALLASGMRLACQATLLGDATVTIPESAVITNIQLEGALPSFALQPMQGQYGLAVDIGTTTLALRLVDLKTGALLHSAAAANPQGSIAADVVGRMEAALSGQGTKLQALVTGAIETAVLSLCASSGITPDSIASAVMAGNTTMLYLLTGRDPASLSRTPFAADCLFHLHTNGAALSIPSLANTDIFLPACASAFVGADIVCGILAAGMHERNTTSLLVDLGTNGEIALWHEGTLYCCATAAGPAFEGVNISCGVGSVEGAIDSVQARGARLAYTTIGGHTPVGICGSGLIDAVAALLELELIDETGLMHSDAVTIGGTVSLTQQDIRSIQLAKGAIAAGIQTICAHVGIDTEQIDTLYIAGGFGSHVSVANAAAIGLIPKALTSKAKVLGNASLTGTLMMLLRQTYMRTAADIASHSVTIPLGGSAAFASYYMDCMLFS